jgi:CheY-like chemotaxis protein
MSTVLVVDDELALAEIVALSLAEEGYDTAVALDGRQGLELARRMSPDVIITDLMMPIMDGWALCVVLQEDPLLSSVPIVVMSAAVGRAFDQRCRYAAFLRKPFELAELLRVVAQLLGGGDQANAHPTRA